jgi:hypothetical protein
MEFEKNYSELLKGKSIQLLQDALSKCNSEILFINSENIIIHVPKYFYSFIAGNLKGLKFMGYNVEIGYDNEIVIFDSENGFLFNRIFKYKL